MCPNLASRRSAIRGWLLWRPGPGQAMRSSPSSAASDSNETPPSPFGRHVKCGNASEPRNRSITSSRIGAPEPTWIVVKDVAAEPGVKAMTLAADSISKCRKLPNMADWISRLASRADSRALGIDKERRFTSD